MKKVSFISLLLVVSMFFIGCTSEELQLYKAFENSKGIESMESNTDISFTLDVENLPEEDAQVVQQMINTFNDVKVNAQQKTVLNKDKTMTKAEATLGVNFDGMQMDMQVWIDADMSGDEPKMVEIIKMPKILMTPFMEDGGNKEYIVYDIGKMLNQEQQELDFSKFIELGKNMEATLTDFAKEYFTNFDPGFKIATAKGKRVIDGEALSIYEVKLNDATFKKLMRHSANNLLDNEKVIEFMKDYITAVVEIANIEENEKEQAIIEINEGLYGLEEDIPELKKQFNDFMDKFDAVKILGDNGITIEYGVNKDGFITYEKGLVDLNIDIDSIDKTFNSGDLGQSIFSEKAPIVKLSIDFKTNIFNINKDMSITMPEVNSENAVYFHDLY